MGQVPSRPPPSACAPIRPERIQGKDGQSYVIRSIRPTDAASLMRGYDALSDRAKWFRMLHAMPHLTEDMAVNYCSPDPKTECCLVVEGLGDLADEVLGGARIAGMGEGRDAEFSVSFRPEARGLGLARQSLEQVISIARRNRCRTVWGTIARQNLPMRHLASRVGFTLTNDPDEFSLLLAELKLD